MGCLSQDQRGNSFISELKDTIKANVLADRPATLTSAIGLARLYEAHDLTQKPLKFLLTHSKAPNDSASILIKRLIAEEIDGRRKKGLSFKCNGQCGPRHCCKKLSMLQSCFNNSGADKEMEIIDGTPEISLPL